LLCLGMGSRSIGPPGVFRGGPGFARPLRGGETVSFNPYGPRFDPGGSGFRFCGGDELLGFGRNGAGLVNFEFGGRGIGERLEFDEGGGGFADFCGGIGR